MIDTMRIKSFIIAFGILSILPALVSAQAFTQSGGTSYQSFIDAILNVIDSLVVIIIALAGLVFLWGVFKFVSAAGDEKARETGKQFIVWGLIGLTIMFVFWGLVKILTGLIGTGGSISEPPSDLPIAPRR
ncbi:MAG: hypothetical protein HYS44_00505 [Candidatus Niyogibacteria bacterium]|nr:hypothetical protein [Candidatus Niyogibacteria bacterium]